MAETTERPSVLRVAFGVVGDWPEGLAKLPVSFGELRGIEYGAVLLPRRSWDDGARPRAEEPVLSGGFVLSGGIFLPDPFLKELCELWDAIF
jgi:hypothetical protein